MAKWKDRAHREAELSALDVRLAAEPNAVEQRLLRAHVLAGLGRFDEARADYLAVLKQEPDHLVALNDLGTLLHSSGFSSASRTCYAEAVARHPEAASPRVNLANLLLEDGDFTQARMHYEFVLARAPGHAEAHQGLARICAELGQDADADRHRCLGFRERHVTRLPFYGAGDGVPILVLAAAAGGNVPTRFLISNQIYRCTVAIADYLDPAAPLPPHALVFNAIGDADLARDALEAADALIAGTKAPIVNPPRTVLTTGRVDNARRLVGIPNVIAPRTAMFSRAVLSGDAAGSMLRRQGFGFPLLLRRPGFHTGRHFLKVDGPEHLSAAVAALPGKELTAIEFLDAGGADGSVRKYRVMIVDGVLYPMHLAVATQWKVHYFTSAMAEREDHRTEEARFLTDMTHTIGPAAVAGLETVRDILGLDYGGIDFGIDRHGKVLLFEANATMVVNPPDPDRRWDYRRDGVARILDATHAMLRRRIEAGTRANLSPR